MNNKEDRIKYHSITREWGNDVFCAKFSQHLDSWLSQFEKKEKPLMLKLLKNFKYYTTERLNSKVRLLNIKFKEKYGEYYSKAIFAGIEKDFSIGFSSLVYSAYWFANDLYNSSVSNLSELLSCEQVPEVIAIVDDYSGTGGTFIKFVSKLLKLNPNIQNSRIFFLTIHISEDALCNIKNFAKDEDILLECVYLEKSDRAFKNDYIFNEIDARLRENDYRLICESHNVASSITMGYREIAALVSFEYNTPNNTLGIFWTELDNFIVLFPRQQKRRTELASLISKAKQNKNFRKCKIFIQNIEEAKLNSFMVYCVIWGKSFSISRACYDFGFTQVQFRDVMTRLIDDGYLEYDQGRIIASEKLKEYTFSSRFKNYKSIYYNLAKEKKIPVSNCDSEIYLPQNFDNKFNGYK